MNISPGLRDRLIEYVDARQDRLLEIVRRLIQLPSENTPPAGSEKECQLWISQQLADWGLAPDLYFLRELPELETHPLFYPGRDYRERPNLGARRTGSGGGRSLLLSGHIDTVPRGTQNWTRDPFGAAVEGNRIFGRGSNDMKAGVASNLFVMECVAELDLKLRGDLLFETVVDEEFGGCNGTLAGRLRGYNADAAILSEPSAMRICPAQRGGRTAHITFRATNGGVLQNGRFPAGIAEQLACFLSGLKRVFGAARWRQGSRDVCGTCRSGTCFGDEDRYSAVGFREPITVPDSAQVELYWQMMPGEAQADVEREFLSWLKGVVDSSPGVFAQVPEVSFPIRWLPGSAISASEPLVQTLAACAQTVTGKPAPIAGIEGPCDLFIFHQGFNIPAVLWGARGGNTHAADEYVEIDSVISAAKTLLLFVAEWCGGSA